jgi:acyl carrier protein
MHLPVAKIDVQLSLDNMGIDSLMGVELATAIQLETGLELSAMFLMQGQSVAALAASLAQKLAPDAEPTAENIDAMSEAELDALLRRMAAGG